MWNDIWNIIYYYYNQHFLLYDCIIISLQLVQNQIAEPILQNQRLAKAAHRPPKNLQIPEFRSGLVSPGLYIDIHIVRGLRKMEIQR